MTSFRPALPMVAAPAIQAAIVAVAAFAVALAFGALTPPDTGYAQLRKPTWQPTLSALQLGWVLAHLLLAGSVALLLREPTSLARRRALWLVAMQYVTLLSLPSLVFGFDALLFAFVVVWVLWLLTIAAAAAAAQVQTIAGAMQVPLLGWVSFMLVLHGVVLALNTPA